MWLPRYRLFPFVSIFLISLLSSCKLPFVQENPESSVEQSYAGKEQLRFSAINAVNNNPYSVQAVRLAENDACIVYGDYNAKVSVATAEKTAREYAERIAPNITGVFGNYYPSDRLIILLLDIIDEYDPIRNKTYTAGYFSMKDVFPKKFMSNSNEVPMLYIDVNPGKPGDNNFYSTIAHELQHLINFSSRYTRSNPDLNSIKTQTALDRFIASVQQDDWVDEGLSSAAEYIYSKAAGNGHIQDKIGYYNDAKYNKGQSNISKGNNFFTWGENDAFIYDDYATVYLFFQWLRIQTNDDANGTSIYRAIIESEYTDYRAVTTAARKYIPGLFEGTEPTDDQTWERLLETWLAANYINAPKKEDAGGFFGYNGEFTLTPVMLGEKAISLYPGEGVYSELGGKSFGYPQSSLAHIRYAGLDKTENLINRISQNISGSGNALLTFNANSSVTRNKNGVPTGPVEQGTLTGVTPPERPASGRTTGLPAKPLPIDIRPPLRF
jgi:hypothetical protein